MKSHPKEEVQALRNGAKAALRICWPRREVDPPFYSGVELPSKFSSFIKPVQRLLSPFVGSVMEISGIYRPSNLLYTQEKITGYQPGGYHPVNLGDTFKHGRYKICHKLGWGGYSTVWLANDAVYV